MANFRGSYRTGSSVYHVCKDIVLGIVVISEERYDQRYIVHFWWLLGEGGVGGGGGG